MRQTIVAVGDRPPRWAEAAFTEYVARIPHPYTPKLMVIAPGNRARGSGDTARAVDDEGERVLRALPDGAVALLLDERGRSINSVELAALLADAAREGAHLAWLIGGADGHAAKVRARAARSLSLSALTLPHQLVRVTLAEQLYRAWSINAGHPYHRGG